MGTHEVIIAADVNAISQRWSWVPGGTSQSVAQLRGEAVEGLAAGFGLAFANNKHELPTFRRGKTSIDVTMISPSLQSKLKKWNVLDECTSSDHRAILVELSSEPGIEAGAVARKQRYNTRKANWTRFSEALGQPTNEPFSDTISKEQVDELVERLTKRILDAANESMPRKGQHKKSVPWWTQNLTRLKRQANRARKKWQAEREPTARENLKGQYKRMVREYSLTVKRVKRTSWRRFVEESSHRDHYGVIYKIFNNKMTPDTAISSIKTTTGHTEDWASTMKALLCGLFGKEPENEHTDEPGWTGPSESGERWTIMDMMKAIKSVKRKKAPGEDLVEAEMIISLAKSPAGKDLLELFNACRQAGYFPLAWKNAILRILLKGQDKDVTSPKSYRPICLLSVTSKLLERMMSNSLRGVFLDPRHASDKQYGYREGRSTTALIREVIKKVESSEENIVLAIMFDVTGAFDHLRWEHILGELQKRDCPGDLLCLVRSYLSNRSVSVQGVSNTITHKLSKGCPQGSILGPAFWNLCADELLKTIEQAGGLGYMYADDLVILVMARSRREIERRAQPLVDKISDWFTKRELQISKSKTEMIILKDKGNATGNKIGTKKRILKQTTGSVTGSLVKTGRSGKRPPTIKLSGVSIKYSSNVKYLGVTIGTRCTIGEHIEKTGTKARLLFEKLSIICRARWGMTLTNVMTLYRGVFVPIIAYATEAWCPLASETILLDMQKYQRTPLLRACRAYVTTSTEALQVMCGVLPLDLEIKRRFLIGKVKRGEPFEVGDVNIEANQNHKDAIAKVEKALIRIWQGRWEESENGCTTFEYYPDVGTRLEAKWTRFDYFSSQFVSGHGDFNARLAKLGLKQRSTCECGEEETAEHALEHCPRFEDLRKVATEELHKLGVHTGLRVKQNIMKTSATFSIFRELCKAILVRKEDVRRNEENQRAPT
ncbi:unnamed protein product [Trichogramma brassicae]|uniref:Reverse transcriptase domain-containing protein n=1 Tax=Trichogramma brassicae TaxID=86971 RepID=A0A6H5J6H9_9HYME|nr:unnamed protein product [Trichogramma brassicae]